MRYIGGKSKLSTKIVKTILDNKGARNRYLEPFVGGGSVFGKVAQHFYLAECGDAAPDIVAMWQAVARGWIPPSSVTEAEYRAQRHAEISALRGFVGYGCSFGGKWFGGYARGGHNANGVPRNYVAESARAVGKLAPGFSGRSVHLADYREWTPDKNTVVYCDPPYAGTQEYALAKDFKSRTFWEVMDDWHANGALVFVSEYSAPKHWVPVWSSTHRQHLIGLHGKVRPSTTETLWMPC